MRNLVPIFIQQHINNTNGNFNAYVISCDISNFTPFLEALLKKGKQGAEYTGDFLNQTFGSITSIIYKNNGFITNFAGDAFSALFPNSNTNSVINIASNIIRIFEQFNNEHKQKINIRLAISKGNIEWNIIGKDVKIYYFKGEGIKKATTLQQKAIENKICIDDSIPIYKKYRIKQKKSIRFIEPLLTIKTKSKNIKVSNKYNNLFFPDILSQINDIGEFRKTIPVFINFPSNMPKQKLEDFAIFVNKTARQYNGYFNKLDFTEKGGIILVIFGAPYALEKMTENATIFCENIKERFNKLNITIGVDYGITYAGFIGDKHWQEYTILGDIVNTAARLSCMNNNQINLTDNIKNEISNYEFRKIKTCKVKGKSEYINIYTPIKKKQKTIQYMSPFVGRQREIKTIYSLLKKGLNREKDINLFIEGESGIGKTRLILNVLNSHNINYYYCASDTLIMESLGAIKQLFSKIIQFNLYDKTNIKKEKIELFLKNIFPEDYKTYIPYIYYLFSINIHSIDFIDSKERLQTTYFILREILKRIADNKSFVIVFDDIMWADDDTIDFINYAFEHSISGIVKIFIYREFVSKIKHLKIKYQIFRLNTFNKRGVKDFLKKYFNANISKEMIDTLFNKTEGNPLFLEQIALHIDKQNQIYIHNNELHLKGDYKELPANIDRLIMSRLDTLSAKTREGIKKASVIGKEFEIILLKNILENKKHFNNIINEGQNNKIIQIISNEFGVFRHTLLQEIAYKMQFGNTLKKIHKRVGELYELLHKNDIYRYYETLYFHFNKAGLKKKTIHYLKKSIKKNIESYSNDIAYNLIRELLNFDIPKKERIKTMIDAGNILIHTSKYEEAYEFFNNAIILCKNICKERAEAEKGIGDIKWSLGDYNKALEFYNISLKTFEKLKYEKGMSRVCEAIGVVFYNKGDYNKAFEYFERALKLAKRDKTLRNSILSNQGLVLYRQGELDKAMEYYNQALIDAQSNKNLNAQAILHLRIALIYQNKEDYKNSLKHNNISLRLNRKIGNRRSEAIVLGNIGQLYLDMGHFDKVLPYFLKALDIDRDIKNLENESIVLGNIANFYALKKQYKKSLEYYNEALKIDRKIGNKWSEAIDLGNMAELYKLMKYYEESDRFFIKCISIIRKMNARHPLSHFLYQRAQLHIVIKNYDTAMKLLKEAKKIALQIEKKQLTNMCDKSINEIKNIMKKESR